MPKDFADKEKELYKVLRENKKKLFSQIEGFQDDPNFLIDDAENAIRHSWSILARFEDEYESAEKYEELDELLEELRAEREYGKPTVEKYIQTLESINKRITAKIDRLTILSSMQTANRLLGQQMLEHQKIKESKAKQHYMEITEHAQILAAFGDIVFLALRRIGLDEAVVKRLAKEIKKIQRDYPIVKMDLQSIYNRLYGEPDEIVVEAEIIKDDDNPDADFLALKEI